MCEAGTTLVILAGGSGSRMGKPKSWLRVGEQPILKYLLAEWRWAGPTMLITSPGVERPPGAEGMDREICDPVAGEGPLRGILSALESGVDRAVVVAVDMPAMSGEALRWICEKGVKAGLFYRRNGRVESMPMVITASALPTVRQRMAAGRRSVQALTDENGFDVIEVPAHWPAKIWLNANVPAEWAAFCAGVLT